MRPMRPIKLITSKVCWLAACILLSGCLSLDTYENRMARWKAFKAEWEAKGENFDFEKLVPPDVPDEENLAKTLFFEAFAGCRVG